MVTAQKSQLEAAYDRIADLEARLARAQEALADLVELTIFMSGSADFGPEGQAHEGWRRLKPALDRALAYLSNDPAGCADQEERDGTA